MSFTASNSIDGSPLHSINLKSYDGQWGLRWSAYCPITSLTSGSTTLPSFLLTPTMLVSLLFLNLTWKCSHIKSFTLIVPLVRYVFPKISTWTPSSSSSVLWFYIIFLVRLLWPFFKILTSFHIPISSCFILINSIYEHLTILISYFFLLLVYPSLECKHNEIQSFCVHYFIPHA